MRTSDRQHVTITAWILSAALLVNVALARYEVRQWRTASKAWEATARKAMSLNLAVVPSADPHGFPKRQAWDGSTSRCWEWDGAEQKWMWLIDSSVCERRFGPWKSAWDGDRFLGYTGDYQ